MKKQAHHKTALHLLGPTAVGKTSFGLELLPDLATQLGFDGVDLISADSRHVYTELHILTGADLPEPAAIDPRVALHGIDMLDPSGDEPWSLGRFIRLVHAVSHESWETGRLPVVLGGTRLYQAHAYGADPGMLVAPDAAVREQVAAMGLAEVQEWASNLAPERVEAMNRSDWHNPRRLVRVIEIAQARRDGSLAALEAAIAYPDSEWWLGLRRPLPELDVRIERRVQQRFEPALREVQQYRRQYDDIDHPLTSSLGYAALSAVLDEGLSAQAAMERWIAVEQQFAREQLRWWEDDTRICWIDAGEDAIISLELVAARLQAKLA